MNLTIEKRNFDQLSLEPFKEKCSAALDVLWETEWVRSSITRADQAQAEKLQTLADQIVQNSDTVVVLATGMMAKLIDAAVSAAEPQKKGVAILVFGDTLSPSAYAELLEKLEDKQFTIVAVTEGAEPVQFRSAYAVLKRLLIRRCGKEQAAERIFAIAGGGSQLLTLEASENDYPLIAYPDIAPAFGAGTCAVLLPLAICGVDIKRYLSGFYDMLASPVWDADGTDYAIGRVACEKTCGGRATVLFWQKQLAGLAAWQGRAVQLPAAAEQIAEDAFQTLLLVEKDNFDIMTPFFEGCHEDGSLNLLLLETAQQSFVKGSRPGVTLSLEAMDDYNLGQLCAFLQLSDGICEILGQYI